MVLSMPQPSSILNCEMNRASAGIICTMSTSRMMTPPPLNRNRLTATAARKPNSTATTTTIAVTPALMASADQKSRSARMPAKLSTDSGAGKKRGVRLNNSLLVENAAFIIQ